MEILPGYKHPRELITISIFPLNFGRFGLKKIGFKIMVDTKLADCVNFAGFEFYELHIYIIHPGFLFY